MKDSQWSEFSDLNGPWAEWLQRMSLTEGESKDIRNYILNPPNKFSEIEKFRISRQIARIKRIIAFSNRLTEPYSERYKIYK